MKFTVITPCFNALNHVSDTVQSITMQTALQTGRATLEYIVVDGGSTDGTITLLESLLSNFAFGTVRIISEPDQGMYDALAKGIRLATGDMCSYLNIGDLYSPYAFDVILDVLETTPHPWLTGLQTVFNEQGQLVSSRLYFPYRSRLFQSGLYDNITLPYLQQESTFWDRSLNQFIDFERLRSFKYAGDYYLWYCFSQHSNLKVVESQLGGFRIHEGQLSENVAAYTAELRSIARTPHLSDRLIALSDKLIFFLTNRLRQKLYPGQLLSYNHKMGQWNSL